MDQSEGSRNSLHSAVGGITETDVVLAGASNAIIIGFGATVRRKRAAAAQKRVGEIRTYGVIY